MRKEEEKMRRELIKQEYQQRKQQETKTPKPKQRPRPKSVLREESSIDNLSKASPTRKSDKLNAYFCFSVIIPKGFAEVEKHRSVSEAMWYY